jgi:molecular chaperone GrpE
MSDSPQTDDGALEAERERARQAEERMLRVLADSDNQRKRLEREQKETVRFANERLLLEMLPVLDNLERCVLHEADAKELRNGVELTLAQFRQVVENAGVEAVPAAPGIAFDPTVHEAVLQDDEADLPEKTVVRVIQPGFKYRERLLRPARVVVASGKGKRERRSTGARSGFAVEAERPKKEETKPRQIAVSTA